MLVTTPALVTVGSIPPAAMMINGRAAPSNPINRYEVPVGMVRLHFQVTESTGVWSVDTAKAQRLQSTEPADFVAELAAVCSLLGRIPTKEEYMSHIGVIADNAEDIYRYMNFDQIAEYKDVADGVSA